MKRYLLFGWEFDDGYGGMEHFMGSYENIDQAKKNIMRVHQWFRAEHGHIFDLQLEKIILAYDYCSEVKARTWKEYLYTEETLERMGEKWDE